MIFSYLKNRIKKTNQAFPLRKSSIIIIYIYKLILININIFRDSIVVSIPACHAGDRGSIPRLGVPFYFFPRDKMNQNEG